MAEAIQDEVAPHPEEYLERTQRETRRTTSMVDDLLSLTRFQAGLEPRRELIFVRDLVSDTVARANRL